MITVKLNAYLKKANSCKNYSDLHSRIVLLLATENKHFQKNELLCLANFNEKLLDKTLKELVENCLIEMDGWLVRIKEFEELEKEICKELVETF
jgi:orotidine-5'-phosphate decarboxylase